MNDKMKDILEPFRIALKLEREGKQFFIDAAASTKSRLARQTFEFLAGEEDRHIAKIEEFYRSLEISDGKEPIDMEDSDADQKLSAFNEMLANLKDEKDVLDSDIKAYEYALKFENGAEELYEEQMNNATDPRIKKFYKWLIDEESMHSRLLTSCLKFAEDPTAWFEKRKS